MLLIRCNVDRVELTKYVVGGLVLGGYMLIGVQYCAVGYLVGVGDGTLIPTVEISCQYDW